MRIAFISMAISTLLGATSVAYGPLLPQVVEKTLSNGIKILLVEQPGTGAVHVHTFIKGGRNSVGNLPPIATDLLANTLFNRVSPNIESSPNTNLKIDKNIVEKLMTDQLIPELESASVVHPNASTTSPNTIEKIINDRLAKIVDETKVWDKLDDLGASGRSLIVTADYCSYGMDLPKKAIVDWSQIEFDRLNLLPMTRFPIEKNKLILDTIAGTYPNNHYIYTLLTTALPGSPYATSSANVNQSRINAITFNDIKKYAKYAISPENIILILVGDIDSSEIMHQLENTFEKLLKSSNDQTQWESKLSTKDDNEIDLLKSSENRRLTMDTTSNARIFFSWCIPPMNHPDRTILLTLTKILDIRCNNNLAVLQNIVRKLTVQIGVPGQQDVNLLVIEAEPQDGHLLKELERTIKCEITRLKQEPLSNQELHQLQAKMKLADLSIQEDAKKLAETLGECICQGNDWHLAFSALETNRNITAFELQLAAQTYLSSHKMTTILITPHLMSLQMDWTENQIMQIFKKALEYKSGDTIKVQSILEETFRQLRMLSVEEQLQLLKLLGNRAQL